MENYISSSKLIIQSAEENLRISFESPLIKKYQTALTLLQERLKYNQEILEKKLAAPGVPVFLEKTDTLVDDLNAVAEDINKEITLHNSIIADIPGKQQECVTLFQQYIAFKNQSEIAVRNEQRKKEAEQKQALIDAADSHKDKAVKLQAEIAELNKDTINTTAAKDSINALLESVGFRGFRLREKPDSKYVYELIREAPDGSISVVSGDQDISEGERHFIAFLYFYHTVIGSQSDDGRRTDKIVVIDDPVSSMDSDTLFVVAALTRELIGICYNNYALSDDENREDYIKQIFCLTHNPYFFREISYNHLSDHECVSVFEIKKREENKSTIDQCKIDGVDNSLGEANVSPVRNGYDALWQEYCSTESTDVLMIVIRQILEYYFIQLSGYKGGNLRHDLLDKHKEDFEYTRPDGAKDTTDYTLASAMMALLDIGSSDFNDGLYFDSSATNVDRMKVSAVGSLRSCIRNNTMI